MKRLPALTLISFLLSSALALTAFADQLLVFRDQARNIRERETLQLLERAGHFNPALPYRIAATDLNGDGLTEWLFFQRDTRGCESNANCKIAITGISEGDVILLGEMRGGKIATSAEKRYGVRNLLVYNEKNNDFAYQVYVWTPSERAFRPE